ncbi:UNVERIFIED_CONTAM: hypothetical protein Slati_2467100 [Sesamum latifolium]|uniref:Uncharacterized protein n=1 Tax=Sesamum latifolium TaxID=2727402 RepID=A0AAW2WIN7_9LAMI
MRVEAISGEDFTVADRPHAPAKPKSPDSMSKGKEIMVYNPFNVLTMIDNAEPNEGGPKNCSPNREFNLQFIGLLENRVAAQNVARVQSSVKHDWTWFSDSTGLGNRIWLAWDASKVDVSVLLVHPQCLHCRVFVKCTHESSLIAMIYGSNDAITRRELWGQLLLIMEEIDDEPWLVLEDFNTVLDMSEVCGNSGDISMAMAEFQACLMDTGLLTVPLRGANYTWHNCSDGPRSLWKGLDRMLANDNWLHKWPNSVCYRTTPRTSDHSPLILQGYDFRRSKHLFRFDNYLAASSGFLDLVRGVWQHTIYGTPMFGLTRQLKNLKPIFRAQRKEKGNLSTNVEQAKAFLNTVQQILVQVRHDDLLLHLECVARLVLLKALKLEQPILQ